MEWTLDHPKALAGLALSLRKVKKEAADRRIDGELWQNAIWMTPTAA
jgi:hypothetical protein